MIQLSTQTYFSKGGRRACYVHPDHEDRCIKVNIGERENSDTMQDHEVLYLKKLNHGAVPYLPSYHGSIDTDLGPGEVFQLFRDDDGTISKTVKSVCEDNLVDLQRLHRALDQLRDSLLADRVLVHDLNASNILCQQTADGVRLVLVDGIGDPSRLAWIKNFGPLHRIALRRRWKRLLRRIARITS